MPRTRVIRYQTRPDAADENERLIRAVFAQLRERRLKGVDYAVYRQDDDTFVHIVTNEEGGDELPALDAFREFQRELPGRQLVPTSGQEVRRIEHYESTAG